MTNLPWTVPWEIMLPSVAGLCVIVAVLAWLIGRASLRRTFDREVAIAVRRDAAVADLTASNKRLTRDNDGLRIERSELRQTLKAISSLAVQPVGDGPSVRLIGEEYGEAP